MVQMNLLASDKVLKIISSWDALRLRCSEEILLDGVCVVAKRDLDWSLKTVDISG